MKTAGDEFFYSVQGLMLPKNEVDDLVVKDLDFFVDWVQSNMDTIRFLVENHNKSFIYEMKMLSEIFDSIYARKMENDVSQIIKLAEVGNMELCKKLVESFIVNAQTLAIDIQMAQNSKASEKNAEEASSAELAEEDFEDEFEDDPEIDTSKYDELRANYKSIVHSMRTILGLLEQSNFDKAFYIASSISELQDSTFSIPFAAGIEEQDKKRLKKLVDGVISQYTAKIEHINGLTKGSSVLKRLVIVDDMPEILGVLSKMLKDDYQVYAFSDSRQALEFIDKKGRLHAFLLDIDMPEMDGFELAKNIRQRPRYRNTPLIFLTGDSSRKTVIKSLLYDAKAFIVKPASKDVILTKLKECLD